MWGLEVWASGVREVLRFRASSFGLLRPLGVGTALREGNRGF